MYSIYLDGNASYGDHDVRYGEVHQEVVRHTLDRWTDRRQNNYDRNIKRQSHEIVGRAEMEYSVTDGRAWIGTLKRFY